MGRSGRRARAVVLMAILSAVGLSAVVAMPAAAATTVLTWRTPVVLSDPAAGMWDPAIVVSPDGTITVAWAEMTGTGIYSRSSLDGGLTWGSVSTLYSGSTSYGVVLTAAPDGSLIAAWHVASPEYVLYSAVSTDRGATWGTPVQVTPLGQSSYEPTIVVTASNNYVISFMRDLGAGTYGTYRSVSTDQGASWGPMGLLSGSDTDSPRVVESATAGVLVAWAETNGGETDIVTRISPDEGMSWGFFVFHGDSGAIDTNPVLTVLADGTFLLAYDSEVAGVSAISLTSSTDGFSWSAPWTLPVVAGASSSEPVFSVAGSNLLAGWQTFAGAEGRVQTSLSTDGGYTWTVPVGHSDTGYDSFLPTIALRADGLAALLWTNFDGTEGTFGARTSWDSGRTWTPIPTPVVRLSSATLVVSDTGQVSAALDADSAQSPSVQFTALDPSLVSDPSLANGGVEPRAAIAVGGLLVVVGAAAAATGYLRRRARAVM